MRAGETPTRYQQVWHSHGAETRETRENKVCRQGSGTTLGFAQRSFSLGTPGILLPPSPEQRGAQILGNAHLMASLALHPGGLQMNEVLLE